MFSGTLSTLLAHYSSYLENKDNPEANLEVIKNLLSDTLYQLYNSLEGFVESIRYPNFEGLNDEEKKIKFWIINLK